MEQKNNLFMNIQPGNMVDCDMFKIGLQMGFYDIEYVNCFDDKFLFHATDGLGNFLDDGYFCVPKKLVPITKPLYIPQLYLTKKEALQSIASQESTPTTQKAISTRPAHTQKKHKKSKYKPIQHDDSKFVVYMTREAHTKFYTTCDKNLFPHVTSSNIQYDSRMRFATKHGYCFMIEVPITYKDRILSVINSDRQINAGTTINPNEKHNYPSQKHTHYDRPQKLRELDYCRPVSGRPVKTTAAKPAQKVSGINIVTMPLTLKRTVDQEYNINDLTPQMVEQILGVKWDELCDKYFFYSYDNPLPKRNAPRLLSMRNKFEQHPSFQERSMAFATYGVVDFGKNEYYLEKPLLYDSNLRGELKAYDYELYGTFISYNPKTKQFEKYPRGWIKLDEDVLYSEHILADSFYRHADRILSAYVNQKQKRR